MVPPYELQVCGGFRRGKPDGKDIDLIITQRGVKPAAQLDVCNGGHRDSINGFRTLTADVCSGLWLNCRRPDS